MRSRTASSQAASPASMRAKTLRRPSLVGPGQGDVAAAGAFGCLQAGVLGVGAQDRCLGDGQHPAGGLVDGVEEGGIDDPDLLAVQVTRHGGDPTGHPDLAAPGLELGPVAPEPELQVQGVGEVVAGRGGVHAASDGELADREVLDLGACRPRRP